MSYLGTDNHALTGLDDYDDLVDAIRLLNPKVEEISIHLVTRSKDDHALISQLMETVVKQAAEITHLHAMLSDMKDLLSSIHDHIMEKEKVIIVREITNEEAMRILKEEILPKCEAVSTLDIAEDLGIPLRQAHSLYLQLLDEGILDLD